MSAPIERIPQHKHCVYCGKAFITGEGKYCSEECRSKKAQELNSSKRKLLIIWAIAAAIMIGAIAYELTR
jgi:predicted nucleic acid-binding Zn ribbon protein